MTRTKPASVVPSRSLRRVWALRLSLATYGWASMAMAAGTTSPAHSSARGVEPPAATSAAQLPVKAWCRPARQAPVTAGTPGTPSEHRRASYYVELSGSERDETETDQQTLLRLADLLEDRMRAGLGPSYRVSAVEGVTLDGVKRAASIVIRGPVAPDRNDAMADYANALLECHYADEALQAAEGDAARETAKAKSDEAAAAAEARRLKVAVVPTVVAIRSEMGDDIAKGLKVAFPNDTFASLGGTQVLISAPQYEIRQVMQLVAELDEGALRRRIDGAYTQPLDRPMDLDFPGGSVNDYLDQLTKAAGLSCFVVESDQVRRCLLPAMRLRGVTPDSAARLLGGMKVAQPTGAEPITLSVTRVDPLNVGQGAVPIYRIGGNVPPAAGSPGAGAGAGAGATAPSPSEPRTAVFSVKATPDSLTPQVRQELAAQNEALLAALEVAIPPEERSRTFRVRLHPPSGLLFVTATPEELALVAQVVDKWHR